eukprot:TRINITY_DN8263_c0_g1_i2.p1 TRINITY_DN8263_c0_g1~~TRINITY_DN8263_c0_g1_i2.p1  ORF type:complete len:803 (+),score=129.59 TRINITY_DN8263_c0_g1_i2:201-2609(+)
MHPSFYFFFVLLLTSTTLCALNPQVNMMGLKVVGNQIRNQYNEQVKVIGMTRSGMEYACVQGKGASEGPLTLESVRTIMTWGVNTVRIPLNTNCWLGVNGANPGGQAYIQVVKDYVDLLTSCGLSVWLDLHWDGPTGKLATGQYPMPSKDYAVTFWRQVATMFASYSNVVFDLYNENFPCLNGYQGMTCTMPTCDGSNQVANTQAWLCWRDGGAACTGAPNSFTGMQTLVNTVRATGARNIIVLGGLHWAACLGPMMLTHMPADPLRQIVASYHPYKTHGCSTQSCWNNLIYPMVSSLPLVIGEFGQYDCGTEFIRQAMTWADQYGIGYIGYTWNTWACTAPAAITDYNGTPTVYGKGLKDHFLSVTTPRQMPSAYVCTGGVCGSPDPPMVQVPVGPVRIKSKATGKYLTVSSSKVLVASTSSQVTAAVFVVANVAGGVSIRSQASSQFVSSSTNADPLIASKAAASTWETFILIASGGCFAIQAASNGKLVAVSSASSTAGQLKATASVSSTDSSVVFCLESLSPVPLGSVSLQSRVNNKYIVVSSSKVLQATATSSSSAATFVSATGSGGTTLNHQASNMFVCADNTGASPLIANRAAASTWESFTLVSQSANCFYILSKANNMLVAVSTAAATKDTLIANVSPSATLDSAVVFCLSSPGTVPVVPPASSTSGTGNIPSTSSGASIISTTGAASFTSTTGANRGCSVAVSHLLSSSWLSGGVTVTQWNALLTNSGSSSVSVVFSLPPTVQIWNVDLVSGTTNRYTLPAYQGSLQPGASYAFGYVAEGSTPLSATILTPAC